MLCYTFTRIGRILLKVAFKEEDYKTELDEDINIEKRSLLSHNLFQLLQWRNIQ